MTDDLPTRQMLRHAREYVRLNEREMRHLLSRTATRIEALEDELRMVTTQRDAFFQTVADRDAVIAEALAGLRDGSPSPTHVWTAIDVLSRVPQGAAEPSDERRVCPRHGYTCPSTYDHEPWTDPKPWRDRHTGARFDRQNLLTLAYEYVPRTREQYDAEEGNRG